MHTVCPPLVRSLCRGFHPPAVQFLTVSPMSRFIDAAASRQVLFTAMAARSGDPSGCQEFQPRRNALYSLARQWEEAPLIVHGNASMDV